VATADRCAGDVKLLLPVFACCIFRFEILQYRHLYPVVGSLLFGMTSVLPSALSLLDDLRTLLIDDGAALSACAAAHMLKVPVILARKLLAAVLSENSSELRALCLVSGCQQGRCCLLLVPSSAAAATVASMDASPAADVQLYGVCRSSHAHPEIFFAREQAMTAHGVMERQLLSEVHHSSVGVRQASDLCCTFSGARLLRDLVIFSGWYCVCPARACGIAGVVCAGRCQSARAHPYPPVSIHASHFS
jgi:hypothetical protein